MESAWRVGSNKRNPGHEAGSIDAAMGGGRGKSYSGDGGVACGASLSQHS